MPVLDHICLIGFGEVGRIFGEALTARGVGRLTAYDPLFASKDSRPSQAAAKAGIETSATAPEAARGAELIISAVTAAQALKAARSVVGGMRDGAFFLDLNSASPGTKVAASKAIDAGGGRYVEAAVMSSVPPKGLATPMLLGGVHAEAFLAFAAPLQLDTRLFSTEVGLASATKMCRSVMVKGVEALLAECLLTARRYGVEATVLGSLTDMLPNPDWERHARYMISRSLIHGKRRAEEMREAAKTVHEAGVEPLMSAAIAQRQDWAYDLARQLQPGAVDEPDLGKLLDAMRALIEAEEGV